MWRLPVLNFLAVPPENEDEKSVVLYVLAWYALGVICFGLGWYLSGVWSVLFWVPCALFMALGLVFDWFVYIIVVIDHVFLDDRSLWQ